MTELPDLIVTHQRLPRTELARLVREGFGDMVKLVVDVERRAAAVGGQLHADGEAALLADGSVQEDLWGANYYPGRGPSDCIEYTALINIRPARGNRGMEIADARTREQVRAVVLDLVGEGEAL